MVEIKSNNLDDQHEGQPVTGPTSTDGTLDDQHEGRPVVGFEISAGGATNLVIAESNHDHAADAPALTQDHALSVAESYHLHDADNLIVTQSGAVTNLTVSACDNLHEADSIILTALHILTVAECYHDHAPPNLTITQSTALTVQACDHDHSADTFALTQKNILQSLDSYHEQIADNVVLTADTATLWEAFGAEGTYGAFNTNYRMPFSAAAAFPAHNQVRFKIAAHPTSQSHITTMSVGLRSGSTDDFSQAPVAVTFSGNPGLVLAAAAESVWSDWVDFDPSANFLAHIYAAGSHSCKRWTTGIGVYNDQGDDTSLELTVSMDLWAGYTIYIEAIESRIGVVSLAVDDSSHDHVADQADIADFYLSVVDSAHSMDSDTPNPSMDITDLVVSETAHTHAADNLSLALTIAIAEGSHEHAADAIAALTIGLQPSPCDHLHDVDTLALTQVHTLAVGGADHLHDADNVAITGVHSLVVAGADHLHDVGSLALGIPLAVSDTAHDLVSPELTLVSGFDLVIDDAVNEHAVDSIALTLTLTTADCRHDTAADALVLTGIHNLSVNEAYHTHSGERCQLVEAGDLPVDSPGSDMDSDNVTLTGTHILAVRNAYHVSTVDANLAITQNHFLDMDASHIAHEHYADNILFAALPELADTWLESATVIQLIFSATEKTIIDSATDLRRVA